jgi:hypothetical protein
MQSSGISSAVRQVRALGQEQAHRAPPDLARVGVAIGNDPNPRTLDSFREARHNGTPETGEVARNTGTEILNNGDVLCGAYKVTDVLGEVSAPSIDTASGELDPTTQRRFEALRRRLIAARSESLKVRPHFEVTPNPARDRATYSLEILQTAPVIPWCSSLMRCQSRHDQSALPKSKRAPGPPRKRSPTPGSIPGGHVFI